MPACSLPLPTAADASLTARLAEAISDGRDGYALVVPLAPLTAAASLDRARRLAIRFLTGLTGKRGAFLAPLPPADLLLVCPGVPAEEIRARLGWIAQVLGPGVLEPGVLEPGVLEPGVLEPGVLEANAGAAPATGSVAPGAVTWYPLRDTAAVDALTTLVRQRDQGTAGSGRERGAADAPVRPLTPEVLAELCEGLRTAEVAPFIRRQRALALGNGPIPQPLLCETFVSIPALSAALAPGVDLQSNGALFQFLTGVLDEKLLRDLPAGAPPAPEPISLNLNIASIASPAFDGFARSWSRWAPPVIELQAADVMAHGETFVHARAALKERGFSVLIDALQPKALVAMNVAGLAADWLKLFWTEGVGRGWSKGEQSTFARRIAEIGRERLILARVDGEDALRWGLGCGITRFQGHFIDRLTAALGRTGRM